MLGVVPGTQHIDASDGHFYTICSGNFLFEEAIEKRRLKHRSLIHKTRIGLGLISSC